MHLHIIGICGTFMAGIAVIAKQLGHEVTGCDHNVYPPMSTFLEEHGISVEQGFSPAQLQSKPDCVVIGNAMSRGNPLVEAVLVENIPFVSGPQWLSENVMKDYHVIAVAGTHGKTTTSSLVAWILDYAGLNPSFLIGGIARNFNSSARVTKAPYFVIEADEYDTAFFDKRPKFMHYKPRTLIMNNIEYDHADIYSSLDAIKLQFHYLVRTVPGDGLIIHPKKDENVQAVLEKGCWTPCADLALTDAKWSTENVKNDYSQFTVLKNNQFYGTVTWGLLGQHNMLNAMAAIIAADHVGIASDEVIGALPKFENAKRRLEIRGVVNNITVYDDFAHHPTAVETTLNGLRQHVGESRILVVLEFSSYTMRKGVLRGQFNRALGAAEKIYLLQPEGEEWVTALAKEIGSKAAAYEEVDSIVRDVIAEVKSGDHILVMGKSGFGNIHEKLLENLQD